MIRDLTLASDAACSEEHEISGLDGHQFRQFYEETAPSLWAYLARMSGDAALADDLTQEAYVRVLGVDLAAMDGAGRKRYLFRVGTNLFHDHRRRVRVRILGIVPQGSRLDARARVELRVDLGRVWRQLKQRERQMLWLAYVEGFNHVEIGEVLGVKPDSVRPLLFRARQAMAKLLRNHGLA